MGSVQRLVALERRVVQQRREQVEACLRAVGEANGDCTVELDHRGWCELHERAVEVGDLPPVGLLLHLERRDRRLQLVLTGAPQAHGTLQRPKALADARVVPPRAVLLADREVAAVLVDTRAAPRVMQQHQREQSPHLAVVRHQLAQHQAEPDRLVAQLLAHETVALGGGVALIEDQIDHAEHPAHSIRQLLIGGTSYGIRASAIFRLARTIRLPIVGSATRNARAISPVVRPPSARSVSATRADTPSAGWQQVKISRKRSSTIELSSITARCSCWSRRTSSASRPARSATERSRRRRSIARRRAVTVSHAPGFAGTPSRGHVVSAAA